MKKKSYLERDKDNFKNREREIKFNHEITLKSHLYRSAFMHLLKVRNGSLTCPSVISAGKVIGSQAHVMDEGSYTICLSGYLASLYEIEYKGLKAGLWPLQKGHLPSRQ